jgi:glycolate oxidase
MTDVIDVKKEKDRKRNIYANISKEKVLEELIKICGKEYVSDKPHDLYPYSYDMTEVEGHMPDFVVIPETVEEIVQLNKFCDANKIPIVPYATGNNVAGLTIPQHGGIMCDMGKRMKKIIKVHDSAMYAILEPGVTFGQLRKYLDKNHPDLKYTYPFAPPYASVAMNALMAGETNITSNGTTADWINGLEVVLNNGDVVRTGSCFISKEFKDDNWFYRQSIPDLTGLFICWQGLTGIVTKCAVKLVPKREFNTAFGIVLYDSEVCTDLLKKLGRTECCDDLVIVNLELLKALLNHYYRSVENQFKAQKYEDEPDWALYFTISGQTKEILDAKVKYIKEFVEEAKEKSDRVFMANLFTFQAFFGELIGLLFELPKFIQSFYYWNSITWIGSYANQDNFPTLMDEAIKLYRKYDMEPLIYLKGMNNGHYGLYRVITRFNKNKELETVKKLNEEILELMLDYDCVPDKTPAWITDRLREKGDPNWFKLLERIKKAMDPNGIFNPGKWGLD